MKAIFSILAAEFKGERYKFMLNNFVGFTEMTLYLLLAIVNKQHWQHSSEFLRLELHLAMEILFLLILFIYFCSFSINIQQQNFLQAVFFSQKIRYYGEKDLSCEIFFKY